MMKLSCLSTSYQKTFQAGEMDLPSFINTARSLSLDGVDLHANSFPADDLPYLKEIKMQCLRLGLTIACVNFFNDFGLSGEALDRQREFIRRWTDNAAFLGSPLLRVFAGWTPEGDEEAAAWARAISSLKEAASYAETKGVVLGLQNHNHNGLTKVGGDVLRVLEEVSNPYLSHILDTGQYADFYPSIEQTADKAVFVRAKIYEIETGVEKRLDYCKIFHILNRVRYNGFVSIVFEGQEDAREAVPKAVRFLRRFTG
jgi:sugar phosphate isomerase/epimerase